MTKIGIREINLVKKAVYELTGNRLNDRKDVMIQNRLSKLMQKFSTLQSVDELLACVKSGRHRDEFINTFTTNKTEFFREEVQFIDLIDRVFTKHFNGENKEISIFCSASSTGEEPYSIAISFLHFKEAAQKLHLNAKITATDIDTDVLGRANEGVYKHPMQKEIFPSWISPARYFKKRDIEGEPYFLIKAKESLKRLIEFKRLNLFDEKYPFLPSSLDVIFCRNVLIYFHADDQNRILKKLFSYLKVGGTLYLGHSESPLELIGSVSRMGSNIFIKEKEL